MRRALVRLRSTYLITMSLGSKQDARHPTKPTTDDMSVERAAHNMHWSGQKATFR